MKKQLTILAVLLVSIIFTWSQRIRMNTTIPCNNDLLVKTPGRWLKISEGYHVTMTKQQQQEIEKRLNVIHKWVTDIYPEPMAFDATPSFLAYDENFAYQLDVEHSVNKSSPVSIGGTSTIRYHYFVKFCQYFCSSDGKQIIRGQGCETGTNVDVDINSLDGFFSPLSLDDYFVDNMRIDGRPIKMMPALVGKWRGYDFYNQHGVEDPKYILLHREGELPYIPVTRKEYLDRYYKCLQIFFKQINSSYEKSEGLITLMTKSELEEQKKKQLKIQDDVMKYYKDEVEATTRAGLLDSPAVLFGDIMPVLTQYPIFTTQARGGKMLVTENPSYFKKTMPKQTPQLIVLSIDFVKDWMPEGMNPFPLYDKNFPIEKLQAMIDK